jgi:hypothetical protein
MSPSVHLLGELYLALKQYARLVTAWMDDSESVNMSMTRAAWCVSSEVSGLCKLHRGSTPYK